MERSCFLKLCPFYVVLVVFTLCWWVGFPSKLFYYGGAKSNAQDSSTALLCAASQQCCELLGKLVEAGGLWPVLGLVLRLSKSFLEAFSRRTKDS